MTELVFVMGRGQNHFFMEMAAALCQELNAIGIDARIVVGEAPPPRAGRVHVFLPPHEYFELECDGHLDGAGERVLARSILICAEQPGSRWFDDDVRLARHAGAVFDINRDAVREWALCGVEAAQLPLGFTPAWDRAPFVSPRDIDIAFLGSRSERRERQLGAFSRELSRWRSHLVLSDNGRPNAGGPDFVVADAKRDMLARARVLLNIHVDDRPYFEALRVTEAIMCGCVVVSEHSGDSHPLEPGTHFLPARAENLMLVAQELLDDETARREFADRAHRSLRDDAPMSSSARRLAAAAVELDRAAPVVAGPVMRARALTRPKPEQRPPDITSDPRASSLHRAVKQLKIDSIETRRRIERLELRAAEKEDRLEVVTQSPAHGARIPRVSVIVSLYDYERSITGALDSVAASRFADWEVIVVDDASTDASLNRAVAWCDARPDLDTTVLRHPANRGLPRTRNAAADFARGEFVFVLDADNEVMPHCLERLVEALDQDSVAAFAYGMSERFDDSGTLGLLSVGGWDPDRFRAANYIDAMALVRVDALRALGGYADDSRLYGWEDYDLWCAVAERGWYGVAVREIVGRYRVADTSMLASVTTLSATDAYAALIERHPEVMAGISAPM